MFVNYFTHQYLNIRIIFAFTFHTTFVLWTFRQQNTIFQWQHLQQYFSNTSLLIWLSFVFLASFSLLKMGSVLEYVFTLLYLWNWSNIADINGLFLILLPISIQITKKYFQRANRGFGELARLIQKKNRSFNMTQQSLTNIHHYSVIYIRPWLRTERIRDNPSVELNYNAVTKFARFLKNKNNGMWFLFRGWTGLAVFYFWDCLTSMR